MSERPLELGKLALLVVLALAAFLPFTRNGFIWDDDLWVTANPTLLTSQGLWDIWFRLGSNPQYYPLVHTVFWLEYHTWGLEPFGYHLVNVLLHALSAVLLWRLLARLAVPGALLGALVFAVHPMQVESVAWITELKNVLSCVFYLLAAHAFLRFWELEGSVAGWKRWRFHALALVCFACALLSKTVTSTLPAALVLLAWWKQPKFRWRWILEVAPMLALGAGMALVTAWMEKQFVGASGPDWAFTPIDRLLIAGRVAWFYLGKFVWPHPMLFLYPRWTIDAHEAWQYLFPVAFVAAILALYFLRRRIGKGPVTALLFYVGTLVPALGFVNVYPMRFSFVANHFSYHALMGPAALLGALAYLTRERLGAALRPVWMGAGVVATAALMMITWSQVPSYADQPTLWRSVLERNPTCWIAHVNLGMDGYQRGDLNAAERHYREVVRLAPHFKTAHFNLGSVLERLGRIPEAIAEYEAEIAEHPKTALVHVNLGVLLARTGNVQKAIEHLQDGVRLDPATPEFRFNLGAALEQTGQPAKAAEQFTEALRLGSRDPRVYDSFARVHVALGQVDQALAGMRTFAAARPDDKAAREVVEKLQRLQARKVKDAQPK